MNFGKFRQALADFGKRLLHPLRRKYYLIDYVLPEQSLVLSSVAYIKKQPVVHSTGIENLRTLAEAETIHLADPGVDPFVPVGKYYRDGTFVRSKIFVCDVPEARLHVGTGMVCTRDMEIIPDFEYRLHEYSEFRKRKPTNVRRLTGNYSTITNCFAANIGHWWIDCVPRILSLAKVEPTAQLTILLSDTLPAVHRESLGYVLPANFVLEYHPAATWLQLENFLWPSMVSGRCNYHLPTEYNEFMRRPIFDRFGLPARHTKTERIYISRSRARWRRVTNETALLALIARYGFRRVYLEDLTFGQQVELFHRAEIVMGPHGAGINTILFAGDIDVVVFYPIANPQNYFHSQAIGLGQRHHFTTGTGREDDDFEVDLVKLQGLLENELDLRPSTAPA